jgi:hypothetical protein
MFYFLFLNVLKNVNNKKLKKPKITAVDNAKIKLPTKYCCILFFMAVKVIEVSNTNWVSEGTI